MPENIIMRSSETSEHQQQMHMLMRKCPGSYSLHNQLLIMRSLNMLNCHSTGSYSSRAHTDIKTLAALETYESEGFTEDNVVGGGYFDN